MKLRLIWFAAALAAGTFSVAIAKDKAGTDPAAGKRASVLVELDSLPASAGRGRADVYLAVAQASGASDVLRGENQGRRLHHVAIVRSIQQVGSVSGKEAFAQDVPLPNADGWKNLRIVAF